MARSLRRIILTSTMLYAAGCSEPHPTQEHEIGGAEVKWYNDTAIQNAIIAQHTMYPYHFVTDAATVNELGERDLGVLIEHFKAHPGKLNVRRGDISEDLYQSRISFVTERLMHCGVKLGPIEDGSPAGSGMPSDRVLTVLQRSYEYQGSTAAGSVGPAPGGAKVKGSGQ